MSETSQPAGAALHAAIQTATEAILKEGPLRVVLSAPRKDANLKKATLRPVGSGWQLETLTPTQAFHQNAATTAKAAGLLAGLLQTSFTQLTAWTEHREYQLKITKKGKVLSTSRAAENRAAEDPAAGGPAGSPAEDNPAANAAANGTQPHNRQKNSPLAEGIAIPALADLGVLTADGRPIAAQRDKWRQINRFVELVADAFPSPDAGSAPAPENPLRIVDFGCGKSYLTFVLYHYFTAVRGWPVEMTGLDLRADVVDTCNTAAARYGYQNLRFEVGDIAAWQNTRPLDMVVTLHACDTATDHALAKAVQWGAKRILSVPCCQHEAMGQMESDELSILTRYGIVKERTAALMTDAIRANLLKAAGYKTQLVEFVDMAHTPKNILIRAAKTHMPQRQRQTALEEVHRLCQAFALKPTLLQLLQGQGVLPNV